MIPEGNPESLCVTVTQDGRCVAQTRQRKECLAEAQNVRKQERTSEKQKGLRDRNSPTCTLSQNGYGADLCQWFVMGQAT